MINLLTTIKNVTAKLVARIESDEQGTSLVETAIVLMFMFVMTFGIIDITRAVYTNTVVTAAAQEGVRAGIINEDAIRSTVESKMFGLSMTNTNVEVTNNGEIVEVAIVYDFEFITPLANVFLESLEFDGKASMMVSM